MLSLAAFRYRDVLQSAGGPIARLEATDTTVLGRREFIANAFLRDGLAGDLWRGGVFSVANGSGTAPSPMVARYMAISEALERWAHWQLHGGSERARYGFDVDPSS